MEIQTSGKMDRMLWSVAGALVFATLSLCLTLTSTSGVRADDSSVDNIAIYVPVSCTLSASSNLENAIVMNAGQYESGIGNTTLTTFCNDTAG